MGDPTDPPAEFIATCRNVVGAAHVLTAAEDKLRFESDFWGQYRGAALAVLRPGNIAEVAQLMVLAARYGVPLVPQAGNTGLVNGGIPDGRGREAVLSLERFNRLRAIERPATIWSRKRDVCWIDYSRGRLRSGGFSVSHGIGWHLPDRRQSFDKCRRHQRSAVRHGPEQQRANM